MIKLIAMDMDGTLLNSQKKISPRTKEALLRAQEAGMILILASGRPTSGLTGFARELSMDRHHGLLVCYNGSKVVDCQSGEELFNQAMTVEEGKAVLEHMKKFVLDYAADVMERTAGNPLMKEEHKAEKFRNVARALSLYNQEIITTDEAIKLILEA